MKAVLLSLLLTIGCVVPRGGIGANDACGAAAVIAVAVVAAATYQEPDDEPLCRDDEMDPPHTCPRKTR
jgi:hypothetical protein